MRRCRIANAMARTDRARLAPKTGATRPGPGRRQRGGRPFRYAAALDEASLRARVGRRELSELIERYGAGSVAGFATELGEGDLADRLARGARAPAGTARCARRRGARA